MEAKKLLCKGGYTNLVEKVTGNVLNDDVMEYENAGAHIIIMGKLVKMNVLSTILRHVVKDGPVSQPGMTLMVDRDAMVWRMREVG